MKDNVNDMQIFQTGASSVDFTNILCAALKLLMSVDSERFFGAWHKKAYSVRVGHNIVGETEWLLLHQISYRIAFSAKLLVKLTPQRKVEFSSKVYLQDI